MTLENRLDGTQYLSSYESSADNLSHHMAAVTCVCVSHTQIPWHPVLNTMPKIHLETHIVGITILRLATIPLNAPNLLFTASLQTLNVHLSHRSDQRSLDPLEAL